MNKKFLNSLIISLFIFSIFVFPAIAQTNQKNSKKIFDTVCMQNAVNKRENTIISSVNIFSASIKSAMEARKSSLNSAWAISDTNERRTAIKKAWNDFKDKNKEATMGFRTEKKQAWKTFYTERKLCGTAGTSDDTSTEGHDVKI